MVMVSFSFGKKHLVATVLSVGIFVWLGFVLAGVDLNEPYHLAEQVALPSGDSLAEALGLFPSNTDICTSATAGDGNCVDADTRCDSSGRCSQVCIGSDCMTSWPGGDSWVDSGSYITYSGGNVGIGTSGNPSGKLHVAGEVRATQLVDADNSAYYVNPAGNSLFSSLMFAQSLGDKIKLYGTSDYEIGVASPSTIYYDVPGVHSFRVGGTERANVGSSGVTTNGLTASGNVNFETFTVGVSLSLGQTVADSSYSDAGFCALSKVDILGSQVDCECRVTQRTGYPRQWHIAAVSGSGNCAMNCAMICFG